MKLRIPSLLKSDKTKATLKQFLLSLLATTFSIALTFGTAAVIDHHKKQEAKREIVMMVMYDMYNSLEAIEEVDSTIRQSMHLQRLLLEDTTKFSELWYSIAGTLPQVSYTETTERIFSSSIETINTVGDVFFTEYVADFYRFRLQFKTMVCDSLVNSISRSSILERSQNFINFDYLTYGIMTTGCLNNMRQLFLECQQMMHVTDEEVLAYRNERKRIESRRSEGTDDMVKSLEKLRQLQDDIDRAKLKYQ